ncbi:hypothetical protein EI94DRAFT_1703630 [Lactarius quietus]|nr:hypothetical protein EI94DRAFT_1703630 [Lactarius quietus]
MSSSFTCSLCNKNFCLPGGLNKACKLQAQQKKQYICRNGQGVRVACFHTSSPSHCKFLKTPITQPLPSDPFESPDNPWLPFGNRLEFKWVYYHYVRLQSLAVDIQQGLDLWRVTVSRHHIDLNICDEVPWQNAKDMYDSIDSIAIGRVGWTTHQLSYSGLQPSGIVPCWVDESYELNVWDVLSIFEEQLALKEFNSWFKYTPYEEYNENGSRMYCNLMTGDWAFREANRISQDKKLHGSMFVPIIAGSDKMTVLVATGAQEYYLVYTSLGNITNTTWHGHRNGIVPVAFLPIPKMPKVMKCPDGHFCHVVFGLGPYIADYPEHQEKPPTLASNNSKLQGLGVWDAYYMVMTTIGLDFQLRFKAIYRLKLTLCGTLVTIQRPRGSVTLLSYQ